MVKVQVCSLTVSWRWWRRESFTRLQLFERTLSFDGWLLEALTCSSKKNDFYFSGIKDANMITRSLTSHLWMTCCFPSLHSSDKLPHTKQNTEKPSAHVKLQTACDDPRPETGAVIKVPASAASCNPAAAAAAAQSFTHALCCDSNLTTKSFKYQKMFIL